MNHILIIGASRGLGAALAQGLDTDQDTTVWTVSRTEPPFDGEGRPWIQADLSRPVAAAAAIRSALGERAVSLLLYNAGVWESAPFDEVSDEEVVNIVQVNLTALLLVTKALVPNLRRAEKAQVVLIGSTCGLENEGGDGVCYAATKAATRGAAHALREFFRKDGIRVTCISPGSIASDVRYGEEGAALSKYAGARMPVEDLVRVVTMLRGLSAAACVKEIHLPATLDTDV